MNAPRAIEVIGEGIAFRLDGVDVVAAPEETILQAAARLGLGAAIPRLCYMPGMRPDGNCRACMVEIKGERVLAPSCCRFPAKGMEVQSNNARALASQKMVVELLLADVPKQDLKPGANELFGWAAKLGVEDSRFQNTRGWMPDISHPAMDVNLDACIQ